MEELGDRELLSGPIQISGRRCFLFSALVALILRLPLRH